MKRFSGGSIPAVILLGILAVGSFLFGGFRSAVDWRELRAVVIESDDWGLAGFIPETGAWTGLDREGLNPGRFPSVYWNSTLEDSQMVADLNRVLSSHAGRDGHPAVMQPNYVMSSLGYSPQGWGSFDLPSFAPEYQRPGLWKAVFAGMNGGTWYPEFHAAWHYDPEMRKSRALEDEVAAKATERGIMLFPGSEKARELGAWRSDAEIEAELDHCLGVFRDVFGREVGSVMAPDYHWDGRMENMWTVRGLKVIQGKSEQRNPAWGRGLVGRARKFLDRRWSVWIHQDRVYLERNCRLEPAQAAPEEDVVAACLHAARKAWEAGEPAVVESHRINFVHTDPTVTARGLEALDRFLERITSDPWSLPVFLTDKELAQLRKSGTSWCVKGGSVIVRNATHGTKIVAVPAAALVGIVGISGRTSSSDLLVRVPAGTSFDLVP